MWPSADVEDLSSDEVGVIGDEEGDGASNVIGCAHPSDRDRLTESLDVVSEAALGSTCPKFGHAGHDDSRSDRVNGDTVGGYFVGYGPGERLDAAFGGNVVGAAGVAEGRDARDVQDSPEVAALHGGQHRPGQEKGAAKVHGDDGVPIFGCHIDEIAVTLKAGVVHEDVDFAKRAANFV
jgi:hypothetical protein